MRSAGVPATEPVVLQYALRLLTLRNYTEHELREKFRRRFVLDEEICATVLERLQKMGLQSDTVTASSYVAAKSGWGRQRLMRELHRKGISKEAATQYLPEDDTEKEKAQAVLRSKLRGMPMPTDFAGKQKLMGFLVRRGFSVACARGVLDDYRATDSAAAPPSGAMNPSPTHSP